MDPAIVLRVVHDLQVRIIHLEEELTKALTPQVAVPEPAEADAEVR